MAAVSEVDADVPAYLQPYVDYIRVLDTIPDRERLRLDHQWDAFIASTTGTHGAWPEQGYSFTQGYNEAYERWLSSLAPEARVDGAVGGALAVQHLDRDPLAGEPQVVGLPHRAHPAPPEEANHLVGVAERGADRDAVCHGAAILAQAPTVRRAAAGSHSPGAERMMRA
mgnify:CR=1 FL=1